MFWLKSYICYYDLLYRELFEGCTIIIHLITEYIQKIGKVFRVIQLSSHWHFYTNLGGGSRRSSFECLRDMPNASWSHHGPLAVLVYRWSPDTHPPWHWNQWERIYQNILDVPEEIAGWALYPRISCRDHLHMELLLEHSFFDIEFGQPEHWNLARRPGESWSHSQ